MSDNPGLSADGASPKAPRSDEDLTDAIVRMVKSLGLRAATGDPDTAHLLSMVENELANSMALAVRCWRRTGYSDREIGRELGVTKQAVQKRWPRPNRPADE